MTLNVKSAQVSNVFLIPVGDVVLELIDASGSKIDVTLAVQGNGSNTYSFPLNKPGSTKVHANFTKAGTYYGSMTLYAYSDAAINNSVDFTLTVEGCVAITISGTVELDPGYEQASYQFTLEVR